MIKKIFSIVLLALLFWSFSATISHAKYQKLNVLEYQIDVQKNGDMRITELWDIYVEETNTLFKTFQIDNTYDRITDVTVSEMKGNEPVPFMPSDKYAYYVQKNYYQALKNPDNLFEIAWGVDITDTATRKYKLEYTVKNHVALYNDAAEIYWKLIDESSGIPCSRITGKITLPEGITDLEDLKVWAHGPLNGNIQRVSTNQVYFEVTNLPSREFLEIRILTPANIYPLSNKKVYEEKIGKVIEEETVWANEANRKREIKRVVEEAVKVATIVVSVILIGFYVLKIKKYQKALKENPKLQPEQKYSYYRDIPDEKMSPAEASFVYYFGRNGCPNE